MSWTARVSALRRWPGGKAHSSCRCVPRGFQVDFADGLGHSRRKTAAGAIAGRDSGGSNAAMQDNERRMVKAGFGWMSAAGMVKDTGMKAISSEEAEMSAARINPTKGAPRTFGLDRL